MDELIVRVLRTVACFARLRILSHLVAAEELTLSQLARELGARRDVVSLHLARLASAGLLVRRRSGARCYSSARSPYAESTLSGQVMVWLREALGATPPAKHDGGRRRRSRSSPAATPAAHKTIFEAATALTHPRRLRLLRLLSDGKAATVAELSREVQMSVDAALRHVGKLVRRGYVVPCCPEPGVLAYRSALEAKTPLHASLLDVVRRHWGGCTGST